MNVIEAFGAIVESVGRAVDAAGVALIAIGLLFTTGRFLVRLQRGHAGAYQRYREGLGRTLLLGLEFLVAADVIRTVAVAPTFQSVGVLALVVIIRTFLSWTLEVELEGRWPWQHRRNDATGAISGAGGGDSAEARPSVPTEPAGR
jgi:uncharacterized membrane protein